MADRVANDRSVKSIKAMNGELRVVPLAASAPAADGADAIKVRLLSIIEGGE